MSIFNKVKKWFTADPNWNEVNPKKDKDEYDFSDFVIDTSLGSIIPHPNNNLWGYYNQLPVLPNGMVGGMTTVSYPINAGMSYGYTFDRRYYELIGGIAENISILQDNPDFTRHDYLNGLFRDLENLINDYKST